MSALFLWIEGVPGRPGWDGWFEINSASFGPVRSGNGVGFGGPNPTHALHVSKPTDASSSAIFSRCARGDIGTASLWASGENDVPLFQFDMTDAIVASYSSMGSRFEQFELSYAEAKWKRATNP